MPYLFFRMRRLAQAMERQSGALRVHRWLSRRSLLITAWWRDPAAAEAWLRHPRQHQMLDWAQRRSDLGLWIETFQLTAIQARLHAQGTPDATDH